MTTEISAGGAPASPVILAATPAEAPKPHTLASDLPDDALRNRIAAAKETARRELLAELGIDTPDAAKAALAAQRAADDAKKTETERAAAQAVRLSNLEAAVTAQWQHEAAGLTDEQRKAVTDLAGTDVAGCLRTLNVLRSTWGKPAVPVVEVLATPRVASPVAPATTTPNVPAPASGTVTSPPDHAATYKKLRQTHPFAASQYADRYGDACFKQ